MAEQTFRSPGFFDQEIDATTQVQAPTGIPAAIIGSAQRGPAFVPVTVGSFADFRTKFGDLESGRFGPYAVNEWLKNKQSATFVRVLGAGANTTTSDITATRAKGTVKNAGFKLTSTSNTSGKLVGAVGATQFIVANHKISTDEALIYPQFTDNNSITDKTGVINANLVRAVVFLASGTRLFCMDNTANYSTLGSALGATFVQGNLATVGAIKSSDSQKYFKLVISSTLPTFGTAEGYSGIKILTASLDPRDQSYIGKILNTNPFKFGEEQHLLYADFSLEHELAPVASEAYPTVAVLSGSGATSSTSGDTSVTFLDLFGRFDTRYTTAKTTNFISQPFGDKEYDLFYFETLDDGEAGNNNYKISIANLRASTDPANQYGTFEVQIRGLYDSDTNPQIFERYTNCTLDPNSPNYVAKVIGDRKVFFDFDQTTADERGVKITGLYPNQSKLVRILMCDDVTSGEAPATSLPFGFRGIPTLKTTNTLTDDAVNVLTNKGRVLGSVGSRLLFSSGSLVAAANSLTGSIVPPIPYRIKITRGASSTAGFLGFPGDNERTDGRYYWGINTARIPVSTSVDPNGQTNTLLTPNDGSDFNTIVNAYGKFIGISKLDALVTGTAADAFNDNKFTLARVTTSQTGNANDLSGIFSSQNFTGTVEQIMRETAYYRNGNPVSPAYMLSPDSLLTNRYTFASLLATSSVMFNRFSAYAKFTNIFYGGFDGLDATDKDRVFFRDRAVSTDAGGKALANYSGPLGSPSSVGGEGSFNNNVTSLNAAVGIVTSPLTSNANILAIPGIRDTYVTNNALNAVEDNGLMLYIMDSIKYDKDDNRVYDDSSTRSDPQNTAEQFASRNIDNSFAATFFPDVSINDAVNNKIVKVPSSVAALGVFGFSDQRSAPWFAPAGFDRGSLDFVTNVETRLSQDERDQLYDARINPIASFPTGGFVVFGQKTLQQAKSALDRINVRRMLIEVKRRVKDVAQNLIFEPNNAQTRARLVSGIVPQLSLIQTQQGIESFNVICDSTNNSQSDVDNYKMNCRIVIVPTRTIEFISVDFIITNSGVQFI